MQRSTDATAAKWKHPSDPEQGLTNRSRIGDIALDQIDFRGEAGGGPRRQVVEDADRVTAQKSALQRCEPMKPQPPVTR